MAVVLVGLTSAFERVPFIKPPDMGRMLTAIPRALVAFTLQAAVVAAKPVNDQINVQVAVNLPTSFAYRMISSVCSIKADTADDYEANANFRVTNAMRGQAAGQTNDHGMSSLLTQAFAPIVPERLYHVEPIPTYIMQSIAPLGAPVLDFRFSNVAAAAMAAGTLSFFAQFYEYDIEQVQMFPPLTPILTYSLA